MGLSKVTNNTIFTRGKIPVVVSQQQQSQFERVGNVTQLDNLIAQNLQPSEQFYTSKVLNYIEPFNIGGRIKTTFFSEFSTNFNVGDRVYILNGNYDSADFIEKSGYGKFSDGYRVLSCDGCKIVLDLDYTGILPYEESKLEDLIFLHNITTQEQFNYINTIFIGLSQSDDAFNSNSQKKLFSQFVGNDLGGVCMLHGGHIIRTGATFSEKNDNLLVGTSGVDANKFYIKGLNNQWIDITTRVENNELLFIKSDTVNTVGSEKLIIIGEDFIWNNQTFRERQIYSYESGKWQFDKKSKQPIISKNNFRQGNFAVKSRHNDGLFGSYDSVVKWLGARWSSGIVVNTDWLSGEISQKLRSRVGSIARITSDDLGNLSVIQSLDNGNNEGFGMNYVIDSTIRKSLIRNGNFENTNIGDKLVTTAIQNYYNSTATHSVTIKSGNVVFCDVNSSKLEGGNLNDSIVRNSIISGSKLINNQIIDSVANNTDYIDKAGIEILGADIYSYIRGFDIENTIISTESKIRGVLKFFISDRDFLRLESGDAFYIERINRDFFISGLDNSQKIILPIETKYLLDYYFDAEQLQLGDRISISLKSRWDNKYKYQVKQSPVSKEVETTEYTYNLDITETNFDFCSIDIDSRLFAYYIDLDSNKILVDSESVGLSGIPIEFINETFIGNYIKPSDFRSGLFINSRWQSGYNQSYFSNIIKRDQDGLDIQFSGLNKLRIRLQNNSYDLEYKKSGYDISVGDTVWLDGIYYQNTGTQSDLSGRYLVENISGDQILDIRISAIGFTISNLQNVGDKFLLMGDSGSNYVSLSKFRLENSTISSGLFKRTQIKNTVINNDDFDPLDINFTQNNLQILRFINTMFIDPKNQISAGVYYNSHILNIKFNSGIVHESVWDGPTFESGIFSSGYWKSGVFNQGRFIDCSMTQSIITPFDNNQLYKVWAGGTFSGGEIKNSVWVDGEFLDGRFYDSHFIGGVWRNGILGLSSLPMEKTTFGNLPKIEIGSTISKWYGGTVENAVVGGFGIVYWYGGRFLGGEFTSYGSDSTNESIWYSGDFFGSKITNLARWKSGNFNQGKFLSYYGWDKVGPTQSSNNPSDYGWETGSFLGGEFGSTGLTANSVWFDGDFFNGLFTGRFWRSGNFYRGSFRGSGILGVTASSVSNVSENNFADSYRMNYYGLWRTGLVLDNISNTFTLNNQNIEGRRSVETPNNNLPTCDFSDMLWMGGTFSHRFGLMKDSLFLSGNFNQGQFSGGVFNPYIDRSFSGLTQSFQFSNSCNWIGGDFLGGSFWYSEWKSGKFYDGYMSGAKWNSGTWFYGTADNILWLDGTWKNGNWNGTPYDYNLIVASQSNGINKFVIKSGRENDILKRVNSWNGNNKLHLFNVFSASNVINISQDKLVNSNSWTHSAETYRGIVETQVGTPPKSGYFILSESNLESSTWTIESSLRLVSNTTPAAFINSQGASEASKKPIITNVQDFNLVTIGGDLPFTSNNNILGYNFYNTDGYVDTGTSRKLYAFIGSTTSIFDTPNTKYNIKLTVAVELAKTVNIEVYTGALSYSVYNLDSDAYRYSETRNGVVQQYEDYYARVYTITTTYTPSVEDLSTDSGKIMWIRKNSRGLLRILKCDISRQVVEYNPIINNRLIECFEEGVISFPTASVVLSTESETGKLIGMNFGNGVFKMGMWETGVWNNGYRSMGDTDGWGDDDIVVASDIEQKETYQLNETTWRVTFNIVSGNILKLKLNKKVAIGNIVGLDINGVRKLFGETFDIISISGSKVVVRVVTTFPIREILKDSNLHLIYITQNVWQNGVFLNGYFRGVWTNGVFKGFPRTTEMNETQVVKGFIDGGRIISNKKSVGSQNTLYNTGLVQNMTFLSNNIARVNSQLYSTWFDGNISTQSFVNINLSVKNYSQSNPAISRDLGEDAEIITNTTNLKGFPSDDVLSSTSWFRDVASQETRKYELGLKRTIAQNLMLNDGKFTRPISTILPKVGIRQFISDGWTYSFANPLPGTFSIIVDSNTNNDNGGNLRIMGTMGSGNPLFGTVSLIISNRSALNTIDNRYYESEIIFDKIPTGNNLIYLNLDDDIVQDFNHNKTTSLIKREYFYNKTGNHSYIEIPSSNPLQPINIKSISFYEVDMIPFFQYATQSRIDLSVRAPYFGVAPKIDYTNQSFDFVGNVDLTINYRLINQQNNVSNNRTVSGTSIPIEYNIYRQNIINENQSQE